MISLRRALISDLDSIAKVATSSLESTYKGVMTTEQIDYLNDLSYSQGSLKDQFNKGQIFFIASIDDQDVGFAAVVQEGPDLYHLSKIYVLAQFQHQGVGRALLERVVEAVKKDHPQGACTLELAVNSFNSAASFYKKMGMVKVREQLTDMGGGFVLAQDVMELKLNS